MAYDCVYMFFICLECQRFCQINNVKDWFHLPEFGGLSKAVKQLSKKCLCAECENKLMLEALKEKPAKEAKKNVPTDKLPMRQGTENGSKERRSEDTELLGVRNELRPWDLY